MDDSQGMNGGQMGQSSAEIALERLKSMQLVDKILDASIVGVEPEVASSVEATLAQRGSRYGDFADHARLCQDLMRTVIEFNPGDPTNEDHPLSYPWRRKLNDVQRQALTVIMDKIARILSGDPNYDDNWHDIQGYAKLVEDRLPKESK